MALPGVQIKDRAMRMASAAAVAAQGGVRPARGEWRVHSGTL